MQAGYNGNQDLKIMWNKVQSQKHLINMILSLIAVAIIVFYSICGGSCLSLRGSILGIDLKYIGVVYMVILMSLNVLKRDLFLLILLSAGIGVETFLVGFQIRSSVFCPYCLTFGAIIVMLFLLNLDLTKKWFIVAAIVIGFIAVSLAFEGTAVPTYETGFIGHKIVTGYVCELATRNP